MKNKKGSLITTIINAVFTMFIGFQVLSMISQQVGMLENCTSTSLLTNQTIEIPQADTGSTDSFGGGGAEHFGGYTGEVNHKSFYQKVGQASIIQSDSSLFSSECTLNGLETNVTNDSIVAMTSTLTMLKIVPGFFAIGILAIGIGMIWGSLRRTGLA